ncbi:hypothetical protein FA15DRAFT_753191 [Coprinopsis marcescibilis]|uniref:Uncharacterized protein n=1 Tax=Coprinopsis marcescibilis TaxID=230819 RepID=A0A5C3L7N5_COPMA|nr:hypothetical protein FA15DRAFT_753191 [Coprinopsis marcescibilis]
MNPLTQDLRQLPKVDKSNFVKLFVKEQRAFSAYYQSQGKQHSRTWGQSYDTGSSIGETDKVSGGNGSVVPSLEIGIDTPVLKPRNPGPLRPAERTVSVPDVTEEPKKKMRDRRNSSLLSVRRENFKRPKVSPDVDDYGKRPKLAGGKDRKKLDDLPTVPGEKRRRASPEDREVIFLHDGAENVAEHINRLKERRDRRRAKRDIVKLPQNGTNSGKESDRETDKKKAGSGKTVKPKFPVGFALMHGFKATNVGKSRLTIERCSSGIFSRGKASAKAANIVDTGFSETLFLKGTTSTLKQVHPVLRKPLNSHGSTKRRTSSTTGSLSSKSSLELKKTKKRKVEPMCKSDGVARLKCMDADSSGCGSEAGQRPESVVWDIEREGGVLPSTVPSLPTPRSRIVPHQKKPAIGTSPAKNLQRHLDRGTKHGIQCNLAPSDSVSQCISVPRRQTSKDRRPSVSPYFQADPLVTEIVDPGLTCPQLEACDRDSQESLGEEDENNDSNQITTKIPATVRSVEAPVFSVTNEPCVLDPSRFETLNCASKEYLLEPGSQTLPSSIFYSDHAAGTCFDDGKLFGHRQPNLGYEEPVTDCRGSQPSDDNPITRTRSLLDTPFLFYDSFATVDRDVLNNAVDCEKYWDEQEEEFQGDGLLPATNADYVDDHYCYASSDFSGMANFLPLEPTCMDGNFFEDAQRSAVGDCDPSSDLSAGENGSTFETSHYQNNGMYQGAPTSNKDTPGNIHKLGVLQVPNVLFASDAISRLEADYVKPEPKEGVMPPLNPFNRDSRLENTSGLVKAEPRNDLLGHYTQVKRESKNEDLDQKVPVKAVLALQCPVVKYRKYNTMAEIPYNPENALKEGLKMIESIQPCVNNLIVGTKMRQEVWKRDMENLRSQSSPTTLIAVCGATGAGKSSILNAILDDNIVPTSACTAVVTEIAYHKKPSIDGDVAFLSEAEWRQELAVLLPDLTDEDGNVKRTTDLKSDAGIAWQKVHAVYPSISIERLVKMSPDDIIKYDRNISGILGTTKKIIAKDSKTFGKQIAEYIDSKDQKRGDKGGKKKNDKPKEKTVMDKIREAANKTSEVGKGANSSSSNANDDAALWPLIRQVNVRCPSKALSTGAVLVDLPGVADANAARNNIAKEYMKKASCIWILAPITRAVDDKTAKDLLGDAFKMQLMNGNYDDHCITFIASKCDDISCSEVIHALRLHHDPDLLRIEEKIGDVTEQIKEYKKCKNGADKLLKKSERETNDLRARLEDHKKHLKALQDGEPYTSKFAPQPTYSSSVGKKRKNKRNGKQKSPKRRRSAQSDLDSNEDFSAPESEESECDDVDSDALSDSDESSNDDGNSDSELEVEKGLAVENDDETEDTLNAKIESVKYAIKEARERSKNAKDEKREAADRISSLEKSLAKAQKEKNAFCSKKRSEFSRDVLKEDFRTGLKELDDAAAEERDPENFNPTFNSRDYQAINLPVFTCSSRDYVRLKGQVKGDGVPSCFSNVEDTGIPDLQQWCHQLTLASRERGVRNFMTQLGTFAKSIHTYIQGIGEVTIEDRTDLRAHWETVISEKPAAPADAWARFDSDDDALARFAESDDLYTMDDSEQNENAVDNEGVAYKLCSKFCDLTNDCVDELKNKFKDGLEKKCITGATDAANAAVSLVDGFCASMHWSSYRATLRRHGLWRRDLNVELVNPFTRAIAQSWGQLFETDLFATFESNVLKAVTGLLKDVEASAAPGLKDRTRLQGEACMEEAQVALQGVMAAVRESMNTEQKETSRILSPHVQARLKTSYDEAMDFVGTGSVARQKDFFRNEIEENKSDIFEGGADALLSRLDSAAGSIGEALDNSLGDLAQKIEVNLAVLWEDVRDDPSQLEARTQLLDIATDVQDQVKLWLQAAAAKKAEESASLNEDVDMN